MMGGYGGEFWLGGILHAAVSLIFLIVAVMVIVAVIRHLRGKSPHWSWRYGDRAMSILKERYAKGEISKEEFESMKKDLA